MNPIPIGDLVFEVIQEAHGGFVAECLTESIVTQADTWEELRANVKDAVAGYFFDAPNLDPFDRIWFATRFFPLDETSSRFKRTGARQPSLPSLGLPRSSSSW